ncbi:unnamed protein product [Caenorhabditis angaria]|uniref:Uncharacterized protein n=1 Tax=Caenorhabditis angaria TaxID=860376 RepID=A0A9P1II30_9PELO|nr:unnamed protein product [Caenorhabditis angaria]
MKNFERKLEAIEKQHKWAKYSGALLNQGDELMTKLVDSSGDPNKKAYCSKVHEYVKNLDFVRKHFQETSYKKLQMNTRISICSVLIFIFNVQIQ